MSKYRGTVLEVRPADANHQVVKVKSKGRLYRRTPCETCPWRVDAVGEFPAEAFRISAHTAYDMAEEKFSCHSAGSKKPATCAGFLMRAHHNLSVRFGFIEGLYTDLDEAGIELFDNYRDMAIANGVSPDDPVLAPCR